MNHKINSSTGNEYKLCFCFFFSFFFPLVYIGFRFSLSSNALLWHFRIWKYSENTLTNPLRILISKFHDIWKHDLLITSNICLIRKYPALTNLSKKHWCWPHRQKLTFRLIQCGNQSNVSFTSFVFRVHCQNEKFIVALVEIGTRVPQRSQIDLHVTIHFKTK